MVDATKLHASCPATCRVLADLREPLTAAEDRVEAILHDGAVDWSKPACAHLQRVLHAARAHGLCQRRAAAILSTTRSMHVQWNWSRYSISCVACFVLSCECGECLRHLVATGACIHAAMRVDKNVAQEGWRIKTLVEMLAVCAWRVPQCDVKALQAVNAGAEPYTAMSRVRDSPAATAEYLRKRRHGFPSLAHLAARWARWHTRHRRQLWLRTCRP